jgi:hypothetical protein
MHRLIVDWPSRTCRIRQICPAEIAYRASLLHRSKDLERCNALSRILVEHDCNGNTKPLHKLLKVFQMVSITGTSPVRWAEQVGERGFTVRSRHGCQ